MLFKCFIKIPLSTLKGRVWTSEARSCYPPQLKAYDKSA